MKIRTYCDLDSTLSVETSNIDNWGDYIEYLNDILFRRLCDKDEKVTFKSERFGNLDIIVGLDQFFQDRDGKAFLRTADKVFNRCCQRCPCII